MSSLTSTDSLSNLLLILFLSLHYSCPSKKDPALLILMEFVIINVGDLTHPVELVIWCFLVSLTLA